MAEYIMRKKFPIEGLEIRSRGLVVLFAEPMNPKAEIILGKRGIITKGHKSVALRNDEIGENTLILTMDSQQKAKVIRNYTRAKNVYLFSEYIGLDGSLVNPYGGNLEEYDKCYEAIEGMIKLLVIKLKEEVNEDRNCL